ncbi:hypothetical protein PQ478_19795 [Alkalihalophilus pseudofirmus]|uniref:hypothetical protein n=1 Tax=Alkalihalophilus pseudofirmus TaxID=79885 RepID=UPI00259B17A5|nr:hypothetical protein [Alkalihalophilus pseudofirmus]WEG16723.1 hypothetical protein PQ478_19795 [Alkalihalophilus pseudofirmus]
MKKMILILITIFLFLVFFVLLLTFNASNKTGWGKDYFLDILTDHYLEESGKIRSYGTKKNTEYLLESNGLYMNWLKSQELTEEIYKQKQTIYQYFLVEKGDDAFLAWKLDGNKEANVNAWIDDRRIIEVLGPDDNLTQKIKRSIFKHQIKDSYISDFYDWELKVKSSRVILSYGTNIDIFPQLDMKELYYEISHNDEVFYPELYDLSSQSFSENKEVHMVDQLLIAIELEQLQLNTDPFWNWLVAEWKEHNMISGRYNRNTLVGNKIESGAVYGIASLYATIRNEAFYSQHWKHRGVDIVWKPDGNYEDVHFFDLIWNAP